MTSNANLHEELFLLFFVEWLTDHTKIAKSCTIGLASTFTFEVVTTIKYISANEPIFLAIGSCKLWHLNHLNITFFKTEYIGGHTIHLGLLFLGHAVYTSLEGTHCNRSYVPSFSPCLDLSLQSYFPLPIYN